MSEAIDMMQGTSDRALLSKALLNAAKAFGLPQTEIAAVIGRNRSGLTRDGIDPASKSGELALLFIRLYRSVYALTGGEQEAMIHWLNTPNHFFAATPRNMIQTTEGLVRVVHYLDAMRGRI